MKKKTALAIMVATVGLLVSPTSVFATNPYGMDYSGGALLSSDNVTIDSTVEELTPLISSGNAHVTIPDVSDMWETAYYKGSSCSKFYYLKTWESWGGSSGETTTQIQAASVNIDPYYIVSNDQYTAVVNINGVFLEDGISLSEDNAFAVGVHDDNMGFLSVGDPLYSDNQCENRMDDIKTLAVGGGERVFVETNMKLYKNDSSEVFTSDKLYLGLTDIDAAQSYAILNGNNQLNKNNMFAVSEAALQNPDTSVDLKNRFATGGKYNYIYSEYRPGEDFNSNYVNNVFVKIDQEVQEEGVDVVFGFAATAGSGIQYYAKQYRVNYRSDENGDISGVEEEDIISGNLPSGSTSEPKEEYEFEYWTADVDVVLDDGTIIRAGEKMTLEQVKRVVVDKNITFTAVHDTESEAKVPDTGASTREFNAGEIVVPVFGTILCAFLIRVIPMISRKKVKFNK